MKADGASAELGKMEQLVRLLLDGDRGGAITKALELLSAGTDRQRVITEGVEAAMARLDAKCTVQQFNLLEIMLCGRAATAVLREVFPPTEAPPQTKGTVVLAAPEGDIHDLGKNIVRMVLSVSGYRVVDCGTDCPVGEIATTAQNESAMAVGVSGLISTIIPRVRTVRQTLRDRGLGHVRVLAGGAALKQTTAEQLHVDFVAQTAFDGLHFLNSLAGARG